MKDYLLWEKIGPNATFKPICPGLGWPWVGEFVGFHNNMCVFSTPAELGKWQTPQYLWIYQLQTPITSPTTATVTAIMVGTATVTDTMVGRATITAKMVGRATVTAKMVGRVTVTATMVGTATITAKMVGRATVTATAVGTASYGVCG